MTFSGIGNGRNPKIMVVQRSIVALNGGSKSFVVSNDIAMGVAVRPAVTLESRGHR